MGNIHDVAATAEQSSQHGRIDASANAFCGAVTEEQVRLKISCFNEAAITQNTDRRSKCVAWTHGTPSAQGGLDGG
jgi:hypothetical protein